LSNVSFEAIDYLIREVKIQEFEDETIVFKSGETMNKIFILLEG
jgi:hypothetical protein